MKKNKLTYILFGFSIVLFITASYMIVSFIKTNNSDSEKISIRNTDNTEIINYEDYVFEVGKKITFGGYDWDIIDVDDNSALLLCHDVILSKEYNNVRGYVTWETSSIREWLNSEFFTKSFSEEEKGQILDTTVTADWNPNYNTNPGKDTVDKVFFLSINEILEYFPDKKTRIGRYKDGTKIAWWTRTPGKEQRFGTGVLQSGEIFYSGGYADLNDGDCGVRPAMRINTRVYENNEGIISDVFEKLSISKK